MSYQDRAREMYEQAMEAVHSYVGETVNAIEELSELVDELIDEQSRDRADELIDKILVSLDKMS